MATELVEVPAPVEPESGEAVTGEVETPYDRLIVNERTIAKGLKAFDKQSLAIDETKETVGQALYEIYTDKLWKARRDANGKALYKNFQEYLDSRGWGKTASRAYQLMAEHRKVLKASNETVVESKRGPKPGNPGRSAQTFANQIRNVRNSMRTRAEQMTDIEGEAAKTFIALTEEFIEATDEIVNDLDALAAREAGSEKAE